MSSKRIQKKERTEEIFEFEDQIEKVKKSDTAKAASKESRPNVSEIIGKELKKAKTEKKDAENILTPAEREQLEKQRAREKAALLEQARLAADDNPVDYDEPVIEDDEDISQPPSDSTRVTSVMETPPMWQQFAEERTVAFLAYHPKSTVFTISGCRLRYTGQVSAISSSNFCYLALLAGG